MKTEADSYVAIATLYEKGYLTAARDLVNLTVQEDPENGRLWELKGLIHRELRESDLCRDALETASLLVALQPVGRCALAECYTHVGHSELAREMYCSLVEWDETPLELYIQIAAGLDALGRPDLALNAIRKASSDAPHAAPLFYQMGHYMARCGYPPHLIESVSRRAVSLDPECLTYRIGLASVYHRNERHEDAYNMISQLTEEQICRIPCECCLKRVMDIYERNQDWSRARACRTKLTSMTSEQDFTTKHRS